MSENLFDEKIQQLREKAISEIVIEQSEFSVFREAWKKQEDRTKIVGEAGLNGKIIYRFAE
ncbi:hypothetical protein [uncultured Enterococcus sp.]|uniref:hypothetical protein n=1 Tax=uncultured Enterococcus sp. TaxID=167972 RepID=UPI002AA622C0|nr:hypothetical protein [uncultured Enterococcus sp.]